MTTPEPRQTNPAPVAPPTEPPPPAPPQPTELELLKQQAAEHWDNYLRAVADLDNYRKRARREKDEIAQFTREQVITALLPALDNLERALDHSPTGTPLHDGLLQVQKQFERALGEFGLVEIIARPGDPFDPNHHEAISHVPDPAHPEHAVIQQTQSGYRLGDKLLRPARVVVSSGAPTPAP